jgi:hypothetical protein
MRYVLSATAVLAVVIAGIVSMTGGSQAQVPVRYFGTVTVDGTPQTSIVPVVAEINGKDCSQPATGTMITSGYVIDVTPSLAQECGIANSVIFFKVGTRYASQTGCLVAGMFVELNLTITGAAARPVPPTDQCGPTTAPSPTPTPSATPTPTPSPGTQYSLSILDMNSPCIPAGSNLFCDDARLKLWDGDQAAWRAYYASQGLPAPTGDQVFEATLGFRIEAGDPATIGAIAERLGWPHVRIFASRFRGQTANEQDEWVEIKNIGGGQQDMTQWSVRVEGTNIRWTFEDGFVLQPGQACKFYTGTPGADPCPGTRNVASSGVLPNTSGTLTLWVDFLELKAAEARYDADSNNQPPPPNLQGFS